MEKLRKPLKPIEPIKPSKPQKTVDTTSIYLDGKLSVADILKECNGELHNLYPIFVAGEVNYDDDYYGDGGCTNITHAEFHLEYRKSIPLTADELLAYTQDLNNYKTEYAKYLDEKKKYDQDIKIFNRALKMKKIEDAGKELEELKKKLNSDTAK